MRKAVTDIGDTDSHANPGWLAASGVACLLGWHWPAAALTPTANRHAHSHCADCGIPMDRTAWGVWRVAARARPRGSSAYSPTIRRR